MPKLCQCRRHEIENLIAGLHSCPDTGGISEEDVETDVSEIEKILESDCTCENKEETLEDPNTWPTVTIDQETNTVSSKGKVNVVIQTKMFDLKEEKQSQSPCVHEPDEWNIYCKKCGYTFKKACLHAWEEKKIATYPYYGEDHVVVEDQWWCQKCGLVTCLNPNQE